MQRTDQRERSRGDRRSDAASDERASGGGVRARARGRLGRLFSPKAFVVALALAAVGIVGGGAVLGFVPVLGAVGGFAGLFAVAFALGAIWSSRRYAEVGLAGAVAAGLSFVLNTLGASLPLGAVWLQRHGVTIAGVGVGAGLLVALLGYYFGRDLRTGLTREID